MSAPSKSYMPQLGKQEPDKKNSKVNKTDHSAVCYWNGQSYSEGAVICGDGRELVCWSDGTWYDRGSCAVSRDEMSAYSKADVLTLQAPIESFAPQVLSVEPTELSGRRGLWRCNPGFWNILKIEGQDIALTEYALFRAQAIEWTAEPGGTVHTVACPRQDSGGHFPRAKLHSLIFGVRDHYIFGRPDFGIDGAAGPVWVTVNDTNYSDNGGHLDIRVSWG